jgi:hypothetical protein
MKKLLIILSIFFIPLSAHAQTYLYRGTFRLNSAFLPDGSTPSEYVRRAFRIRKQGNSFVLLANGLSNYDVKLKKSSRSVYTGNSQWLQFNGVFVLLSFAFDRLPNPRVEACERADVSYKGQDGYQIYCGTLRR